MRVTTEAVVGAVTGTLAAPRTLLLGRYDAAGRLQYAGRSTTLSQAAGRALANGLTPPTGAHPWEGWTFSAGWGTQRTLDVHLVQPDLVLEVAVDVARDAAGRWRHPARPHRLRTDVDVAQVPLFGAGDALSVAGAGSGSSAAVRRARPGLWSFGRLSRSPSARQALPGKPGRCRRPRPRCRPRPALAPKGVHP